MGYHPETLVCSFPPCPSTRGRIDAKQPWSLARALYWFEPVIGFDIWHMDPEKRSEGQRTDDSCGWFDRRPGEYAEAVKHILADKGEMQAIRNAMDRSVHQPAGYSERGWRRMVPADCLAATLMAAQRLEHVRRWRRTGKGWGAPRSRDLTVMMLAMNLALNETDNLQTSDEPESFIISIASALNRQFRPWWKHPRWHVHHWQVNFTLARNLRRMVQRCAHCGKRLGFGHCPMSEGGKHYHGDGRPSCGKFGMSAARAQGPAA